MDSSSSTKVTELAGLMPGLLLAGALLQSTALYFVRQLTRELPDSINRGWWRLLGVLILLFLSGYLGFFALKIGGTYTTSEMLVVAIFFLGAVFSLLVCLLALRTTRELKRVFILEQEAITDPLMGIFNRRCLDRRLREEVLRAQRHNLELGLLMVDIDRFKAVNDSWGHQTGDQVLQHVARELLGSLRQTDIVARYGGEEIVVILPHTAAAETAEVAERLRDVIEKHPISTISSGGTPGELSVTVSIGCATVIPHQDTPQSLLQRADRAMYQAKRQGRNQVVCAEPPPVEPSAKSQVA